MIKVPAKRWRTRAELLICLEAARVELERDLSGSLTSQNLAQFCGLSPSHFVRLFKSIYGEPPLAYRARLRMERAKRLIEEGSDVIRASSEVGYSSPSTFCRDFKKRFGVTPGRSQT